MNEDRLTGNAKVIGGQVEEGFGRATGDVKTQLQGKAKQMEGCLRVASASSARSIVRRRDRRPQMSVTIVTSRKTPPSAVAAISGSKRSANQMNAITG
jgi:uncharacterized protein YjbJ (UPF0337 family)